MNGVIAIKIIAKMFGFTGSIKLNNPITPIPAYVCINKPVKATTIPEVAPPIQQTANTFLRGKVTPYVAGSVTPKIEDIKAGKAIDFNF